MSALGAAGEEAMESFVVPAFLIMIFSATLGVVSGDRAARHALVLIRAKRAQFARRSRS